MTTTIAINCGCGFRVTSDIQSIGSGRFPQPNSQIDALVEATEHCRETGHTLEILGQVQP